MLVEKAFTLEELPLDVTAWKVLAMFLMLVLEETTWLLWILPLLFEEGSSLGIWEPLVLLLLLFLRRERLLTMVPPTFSHEISLMMGRGKTLFARSLEN